VGALFKCIFGIPEVETTFERRGFRGGENGMRENIERAGRAFVTGYHAALKEDREAALVARLDQVELTFRGFAYEGAAMGLGLLDRVTPWRRDRVERFLKGAGKPHTYMVHVGLGWVAARMPGGVGKTFEALDPLLRWLVFDGFGFHEGFFHWRKYLNGQPISPRVSGYATRVFDQGLGRSLWFVDGGSIARLRETVGNFPESRRADLWSGIGLASVYAGEVSEPELILLRETAGQFRPELAQGAAFAAKARHRAANPNAYTDRACWILCGMSSADAAALTDAALENLPANGAEPAYEIWRKRIQEKFSQSKELKQ
jgi:enediyne biosynthesis protein E3